MDKSLDSICLLSDDIELQSKIHVSHLKKKKKRDFNKKYSWRRKPALGIPLCVYL